MYKFNMIIRYTVCLLCCLLLVQGCGDKDDPPQTSRVVSKKINIVKKQVPKKKQPVQQKSTSKAESAPSGFAAQKFEQNVEQKAEQKVGKKIKRKDVQKSDLLPVIALNKNIKKENQFRPLALADIYNPKGKIDPFVSLFQEKPAPMMIVTQKRKKRVRRTPLERIDLGQLKLTGIILRSAGNKAMVEEATGRGYVVIKGTSIGKNWGKVTKILKDRIIIEEEGKNLLGKVTLEKKEMKIQRPPGEL